MSMYGQMPMYIQIANWLAWGNLIKTWASGINYFKKPYRQDMPVPPLPRTLDEFKEQCAWAQVGMRIPDRLKGIQFVQSTDDVLLVRLPAKTMIDVAFDPASYKAPLFYLDYYDEAHMKKPYDPDFRTMRIGDYSVSECG